MKKRKPGIIRKFFIFRKLDRLTRGELALQVYLKTSLNELLNLNLDHKTDQKTLDQISFLQQECDKTADRINELQEEKKKTYLKLI
jgi:hypothetical protein